MEHNIEIAELLQRVQSGDGAAACELMETYHSEVFGLALSIMADQAEAEDITQDVFLAAFDALEDYRGDAAFKTWLFRITVNRCRRRWRQRKMKQRVLQALQVAFPAMIARSELPEEIAVRHENKTELWSAVEQLGEKYRLPLLLFYAHGLTVAHIAQILAIPLGTVLSRLHTGRERLSAKLCIQADPDYQAGES